jgi:serine/threonine-protein kinase
VHDELVARMRHEARAAAAVSHPHIVTLHDMGEDPRVGLYLVFEYVAGPRGDGPESLRERLQEGPLPLADVAKLAREIGSALTFAHAAGVIHRDIKPENVLFSRTGAKVADFGIARIPESTITRANMVLGTPAYTSPEALSHGEFGPASDQFAFGATLYEALTGARAFAGEDPVLTAAKVTDEPPPPLPAYLASTPVLRALNTTLAKGLAKESDARFASCVDLGEAVGRAIERATDGAVVDMVLDLPSAARADGQDRIELERTPLSSRVALERAARRTSSYPPAPIPKGLTPARPSIVIRGQNNRWQNVLTAAALVVIVALVLLGKRSGDSGTDVGRGSSPAGSVPSSGNRLPAPSPPASAKRTTPPSATSAPSALAPAADAGAAPVPSSRDEGSP